MEFINYLDIKSCVKKFSAILGLMHRRRIGLEDKVKVVASVWGGAFFQFLATLAVLPWYI